MRYSQALGVDEISEDIAIENGDDTRSISTQQSNDDINLDNPTINAAFQNSMDVKIMVKKHEFEAHSYKLLCIPYFAEIFATDDYKKMKTKIITIKEDIDPKAISTIIEYLYSKELHLTTENVFNILKAAKVLRTDNVVTDECYDHIRVLMHVDFKGISKTDNFIDLGIESLENLFSNPKSPVNTKLFYNFILQWVNHDYSNRKNELGKLLGLIKELPADFINRYLYEEAIFRDLDIESLVNLFKNPKLDKNKDLNYNFVMKWITHDYSNRKSKLGKLLGLIKELKADFIDRSLYREDIFFDLDFASLRSVLSISALNNNTAIILNGIIKWVTHDYENRRTDLAKLLDLIDISNLSADEINVFLYGEKNNYIGYTFRPLAYELHSRHFQSKINKTEDKKIIVIDIFKPKSTSIVEYYPKRNKWSVIGKEKFGEFYLVIVIEDKFYKFQGSRLKQYKASPLVKVYDLETKIWETLCPMNTARKICAAVFFEGFLYVFGGYDNHNEIINSVERYSFESKQWEVMSGMKVERCAPAVIVLDNHIYVIGGRGRGSDANDIYLDTIEVYDIKTNKWSKLEARMKKKRSTCAAAVLNGNIYVCGGWYNEKALNDVEMFDIKRKRWKTVKSMNKAREQFLVVEMHGKLWAIGGCSKEKQINSDSDSSVEVYDFYKDSWSYVNTKFKLKTNPMYITGGFNEKNITKGIE